MIVSKEPWCKEADSKQRGWEDDWEETTPKSPVIFPRGKRHPGWEDDFGEETIPGAPVEESADPGEKTEEESYRELLEKQLEELEEKLKGELLDEQQRERLLQEERERRRKQEEERKRRGRCPFCGGPPHGRGEIGGDP